MIPFTKIDSKRQVTLDIRAVLYSGEICKSSIGALTLEPAINRDIYEHSANSESFGQAMIAICMTTYNPSIEHFKKQIDSIIDQTYTDWACMISDDCSKPEIFEKIKDIIAVDRRFKIYRNPSNLGFYHNFERCLSYVPEEVSFIALADQDDYWHADKLSSLLALFDNDTTLTYSDTNIVNEKGELIHNTYWTTRRNNFSKLDLLILANTITGAASLFRRELLNSLLPFPEMIGDSYHDQFIACVALTMGKIKYVDKPLYDYYQHSGNVIGHCAPTHKATGENLDFFKRVEARRIRGYIKNIRNELMNYRTVYFNHYIRRVLIANILNLRCSNIPRKKRKIIKRFVCLERSLYGMIFQVVKDKILHKSLITIGVDSLILKSALSNKLINIYYRFRRSFLDNSKTI